MLYWARKRGLTILVAENEQVCELFKLRYTTYMYIFVCADKQWQLFYCLTEIHVISLKVKKTLSMVLVFWFGHISAACEPNHMTQGMIL